jgi:hypothetical protein
MSAGAWVNLANPGAAGSEWAQTHTGVTVEAAGGPNGRKWIKNPRNYFDDGVELTGKVLSDLINANAGMLVFLVKSESDKSWLSSIGDLSIFAYVFGGNLGMYIDSAAATKAYTADSWRAGVYRWDGAKSYLKLSGDASWAEGSDGLLSAVTAALRIIGDGTSAGNFGCSLFATYQEQSEATGDAALAYAASLLG